MSIFSFVARPLHLKKVATFGDFMKNPALSKKLAKLETINDQLAAEISYLDQLGASLGSRRGPKNPEISRFGNARFDQRRKDSSRNRDGKSH